MKYGLFELEEDGSHKRDLESALLKLGAAGRVYSASEFAEVAQKGDVLIARLRTGWKSWKQIGLSKELADEAGARILVFGARDKHWLGEQIPLKLVVETEKAWFQLARGEDKPKTGGKPASMSAENKALVDQAVEELNEKEALKASLAGVKRDPDSKPSQESIRAWVAGRGVKLGRRSVKALMDLTPEEVAELAQSRKREVYKCHHCAAGIYHSCPSETNPDWGRWHYLNDGQARKCSRAVCEQSHFDSSQEAQRAYEALMKRAGHKTIKSHGGVSS